MPEFHDGYNNSTTINDINVIITEFRQQLQSRWDPMVGMDLVLLIRDHEGLINLLESLYSNDRMIVRHGDGTWTGTCMSYNVEHNEPGHITMRIQMMTTGNMYESKEEYPHTCRSCGKKLRFRELVDANSPNISEDDLKAMWISNEIKFYCCTCYRRKNGESAWVLGSINDTVGWATTEDSSYNVGEVVSAQPGAFWENISHRGEGCVNCIHAERYGRLSYRCFLEPTQIHMDNYRCDRYDTHDTTEDVITAAIDECDYMRMSYGDNTFEPYTYKQSRFKKIIKKIKKWFKK
jgi:hypothetical protein